MMVVCHVVYTMTLYLPLGALVVLSGSVLYQDTGCQSWWRAVSFSHRRAVQAATTYREGAKIASSSGQSRAVFTLLQESSLLQMIVIGVSE